MNRRKNITNYMKGIFISFLISLLFKKKKRGGKSNTNQDKHLKIKLYDRNQVDDKIVGGLGGGILSIHLMFVLPFLWEKKLWFISAALNEEKAVKICCYKL